MKIDIIARDDVGYRLFTSSIIVVWTEHMLEAARQEVISDAFYKVSKSFKEEAIPRLAKGRS